jgi:hypothetical protein
LKAITIHQPWATLIAIGEKENETRSWATKYRGPLAIHAGKKLDKDACSWYPIIEVLELHDYTVDNLPTGAIVAYANLTGCHEVVGLKGSRSAYLNNHEVVEGKEFAFGWYDLNRYAWKMTEVQKIDPIPAKGQQGLWNYELHGANNLYS